MSGKHRQADHIDWDGRGRGPNGRGLCRRCLTEVPKGRYTFCSNDCSHTHSLLASASYLRAHVYKRDYGICALCGFDSGAAISAYRLAVKAANGDVQVGLQAAEACLKTLQEAGFNLSLGEIKWLSTWQLWEADHIVPLIEGWDGELDNVRTLCVPCHRKETAALRKRLAQARKEAKP